MEKGVSRRNFMKSLGALGIAAAFSPLETLAAQQPAQEKNDPLAYLNQYDSIIDSNLKDYKETHGVAPEKNLIKAMIAVETGSPQHRDTAFKYDPMQIANQGDYALSILQEGGENTRMIGDFSFLKGKKHTPRNNGRGDYSQTNMTAEDSIKGGIGWLFHKAAKRNYVNGKLQITGWRDWKTAVERYNGGGNKNYLKKVLKIKKELDRKEK